MLHASTDPKAFHQLRSFLLGLGVPQKWTILVSVCVFKTFMCSSHVLTPVIHQPISTSVTPCARCFYLLCFSLLSDLTVSYLMQSWGGSLLLKCPTGMIYCTVEVRLFILFLFASRFVFLKPLSCCTALYHSLSWRRKRLNKWANKTNSMSVTSCCTPPLFLSSQPEFNI